MTNEERMALVEALVARLREKISDNLLAGLPYNRNGDQAADQIEADGQRIAELEAALTKSEALQDLAYYNGAKQYAVIAGQSEEAAKEWLSGGCGNRQHDALNALGETK